MANPSTGELPIPWQTFAIVATNAGFVQSQILAVVGLSNSVETTAEQLAEELFSKYAEDCTHFLN